MREVNGAVELAKNHSSNSRPSFSNFKMIDFAPALIPMLYSFIYLATALALALLFIYTSLVITKGTPKRDIQCAKSASQIFRVSIVGSGTASLHREKRSKIVRRYMYSLDNGRSPTMSS